MGAKFFMRVAPQAAEPEARLSEMEELEEICYLKEPTS